MAINMGKVTLPFFGAALALLVFAAAPMAAQAQGYEGLVADDGGSADTDNGAANAADPGSIFQPDYYAKRAEIRRANTKSFRAAVNAEQEQMKAARAAEAKAAQEAIDARVDAAVSAPSNYGTRIDGLKVPPPQMPQTQPAQTTQTQPAQPAQPAGGTTTPGTAGGGGAGAGGRDGTVLERMMNSLQ